MIIESLHSLYLNGEVVLSSLLQQFLQQVIEPLRVVKTSVLGEQLNVFIWHLGKNLIILESFLTCIHLIPPTLLLSPTRSLCCRAETGLVSVEHAGAVKVPPEIENLGEKILFFS